MEDLIKLSKGEEIMVSALGFGIGTVIIGLLTILWSLLMLIYLARCSYYLNRCLNEVKTINEAVQRLKIRRCSEFT